MTRRRKVLLVGLAAGATAGAVGLATAAGTGLSAGTLTTGSAAVTPPKVQPTITGTAVPASAEVGTVLKDRAVLSGVTTTATGTITYTIYGPDDSSCSQVAGSATAAVTAGTTTYEPTTGVVLNTAGTYRWVARYSGDGRNAGAATGCADAAQVVTLVRSGFSATLLRLVNRPGGTAGRPESGDVVEITYSAALAPGSVCAGWTGLGPLTLSATLTDQSVNSVSNDQMTFTASPATCSGGLNVGLLDLGTSAFYNGGGNTKLATYPATMTLTNGGRTLVITLAATASNDVNTVGTSVTATYTPDPDLRAGAQSISTGTASSTGVQF